MEGHLSCYWGNSTVEQWPKELDEKIQTAIEEDDKEEFIKMMKSPEFEKYRATFHPDSLYSCDAVNCAVAMFNGEIEGLADSFRDVPSKAGVTPLHIAVHYSAYAITEFLIKRGDRVDVKCNFEILKLNQATPFDMAIELLAFNEFYPEWLPGQSIFELLVMLCTDRMREKLSVATLIVQNTPKEYVEKALLSYVNQGKLLQVAALCMVAPQLLAPSHPSAPGGLRIVDIILMLQGNKSRTEMEEGLLLLLDLFASFGHRLIAYPQLERPQLSGVQMSLEIAHLLREAARYKQGWPSPNDYFLRFFKPVIFEAEEKKQIDSFKRRVHYMACGLNISGTIRYLHFSLKRSDIQLDYINSVLPDLKPQDADRLSGAIEKKLSSASVFHSRPEVMAILSNKEVNALKEEQPLRLALPTRQIEQPMQSLHKYQAKPKQALDNNLSTRASRVNKVEGSFKLGAFVSGLGTSRLASVLKRFIK